MRRPKVESVRSDLDQEIHQPEQQEARGFERPDQRMVADRLASFDALCLMVAAEPWRTHAARILLAQIPKDLADRFYPELWTATAIAIVSLGAPVERPSMVTQDLLEWNELLARAIESEDDHVIKMVYTYHSEYLRDHNPLYRAAVIEHQTSKARP